MDIKFDSAVNMKIRLSQRDIHDAFQIKLMTQTEGWKILQNYIAVAKESIDDNICRVAVDPASTVTSNVWGGALKSWRQHTALASIIIKRMDDFNERNQKEQEEQNGNENDEL